MMKIFKKADRTARSTNSATPRASIAPIFRNRVAYAAAMEVLG